MTVAELFSKIRQRQVEVEVSTYKPYRDLLIAMVEEKNFDSHEAEIILEQHGKSRKQFEADVETMRKRLQGREQVDQAKSAEATAAKAAAEIADILKQREDFFLKTQPILVAATQKRDQANNQIIQRNAAIRTLRSTVIDPAITESEKAVGEERHRLAEDRQHLARVLDPDHTGSAMRGLNHNRKLIAEWETQLESSEKEDSIQYCKRELLLHQTAAKGFEVPVAKATKRMAELDQQISKLTRELETLDKKKLIP